MKFATAIVAALFAVSLAGAGPALAKDTAPKHSAKMTKKHVHKRSPRVAGWVTRGGFLNGDQNVPYVYANGRNPNSTSIDNRGFGERVFDGPFNSQR
jgi:hypothetical protein